MTGGELSEQLAAERTGDPFLVYRDAESEQVIFEVPGESAEIWVGRSRSAGMCLDFDREVSSLHAKIEVVGGEATLVDDGLSTNGSWVDGERVNGRRRLHDGDMLRFGQTFVLFRSPQEAPVESTVVSSDALTAAGVTPAQRKVLLELCRPFKDGSSFASPATNQQIADALHLSVDAVKTHMRALFEAFGVEDLPQNRKRVALVERAMQSGLISPREL